MIIKGTLKNGYEYKIDDKCFHEMKALKLVKQMKDPETPEAFYDFCEMILGKEQLDDLSEYIETKTGEPAMIEDFSDIVEEITEQAGEPVKNS